MPPSQSRVFNGRYELIRQLARGGMAEVYLGRDQLLDRPVALKVLSSELSRDEAFVERFRREAQAAANLNHPNIVNVYDWGEEDESYFIVMEYVPGRTLSQLIRTEGPLEAQRAATIGADIAAALGFAHRNGVVHRDVKPGNVLITDDDQVKVTDFGIARATRQTTKANLTQTGAVLGTATYFSPEQAEGASVDARGDVYSLGVVLYEMVTGDPPFSGDNPVSIAYKHVREPAVPPRNRNGSVPPPFDAVVMKALAKSPDDRYQSADELRADLLRFSRGRPVAAAEQPTSQVAATRVGRALPGDATRVGTAVGREEVPPRRSRSGVYAVVLLLLLAVLGVLIFLLARALNGNNSGAATVSVPAVNGLTATQARSQLQAAGFTVSEKDQVHAGTTPGTVFNQDPAAGSTEPKGSTVTIFVATSAASKPVPNVIGEDRNTATGLLQAAGFGVTVTREAGTAAFDQVIGQNPGPGSLLELGKTVTIFVSQGPGTTTTTPPASSTTVPQTSTTTSSSSTTTSTTTPATTTTSLFQPTTTSSSTTTTTKPTTSTTIKH